MPPDRGATKLAACRRCHHRHAGGERLLRGLAEGLVGARVDEEVEGGEGLRQLRTAAEAEERHPGQAPLQVAAERPVADHHHPAARQALEDRQQPDPFLGRQPADVADQQLAARREPAPERQAAVARVEPLGVHPPPPHRHLADPVAGEHADGVGGRGEGQGRAPVDALQPAPRRRLRQPQPIAGQEGRHVGLVDGHRRQRQPLGDRDPVRAERERRGQMHDLRLEQAQRRLQPRARQADREGAVAGNGDRERPHHRRSGVVGGAAAAGGEHQRLVAVALEMLEDPEDRVGDAVDLRQEALGYHSDTHAPIVGSADCPAAAWQWRQDDGCKYVRAGPAGSCILPVRSSATASCRFTANLGPRSTST
jgi:hypothetical protein